MIEFKAQKKYIVACVTAALLAPCITTFAVDEDLHNRLSNVKSQMQVQAQRSKQAQAVIGDVFAKLKTIQDQLAAAETAERDITAQLAQTEKNIQTTQAKLVQEQGKLDQRETVFQRRIREIYMHGQLNYLDVVLGAKDFNDFATRVELLRRIVVSDMQLISSIRVHRDAIHQAKSELEAERARQLSLQTAAAKKKQEIAQHKQELQAVLYQAQHDKAVADKAYQELEASSAQIGAMLRKRAADRAAAAAVAAARKRMAEEAARRAAAARSGSKQSGSVYIPPAPVPAGTGRLGWPASGPITSPFGYRIHPIFGRRIFHSGIDIGVGTGTPVHAADAGIVVSAGWISGYGYAVIIDHGGGISTLYAHNSSLLVHAGQSVAKGQVVARSGATGNVTGPHIHFEVRRNGTPVNPLSFL